MGAAASTQLATEFFEDSRRGCPPIHLDMNLDTKKVTDEGIKLMPGGALIVPSMDCPLHQIGDGKGVSGKLRTVDSSRPSKLMSSSRFINQKSRTQKAPEGKPLAKSTKEASDLPGQTPTLAESEAEGNSDLKPLFLIEQEAKPQELFKTVISSSPENSFSGKNKSVANDCPVKLDSQMRPADRTRAADQTSLLSHKDRVASSIPAGASDDRWTEPAKQAFYSSMLRKGWIFKETDMTSENMKNMLKIHSANHELAWREVLKWEALHADECKEPKLKSCSAVGTKYSPRARLRSWIGYSLPFDRHDWIIDRNGKDVRYIIDYYDGGKFNGNFEFALLDVRPALDSFEAFWDRLSVAIWKWTSDSGGSGVPGSSQVSVTSSVSEPLNIGERLGGKTAESLKGKNTSQFMSYNLSDVEKEREKKNSVS
ncbi:unnamed protein product [Candidula unifasciata]|uniref:Holocytochrome c-type synthase n=1 Tax=Candidula unifasciata TaxID=100452 RepID=A0A8S3ZXD2_9EUPU|nr:unnamed protein product [Candidula unifasciata]